MKELLRELLNKDSCRMFLYVKGKLYLLWNHHLQLDPEDSRRVLLGRAPMPNFKKMASVHFSNRDKSARLFYIYNYNPKLL